MWGEPPEPPEWVEDLEIFEDNVKKGYARIQKHIAEKNKDIASLQQELRDRPDSELSKTLLEEKAFCRGLQLAVDMLNTTMGNADSFKDEYWLTHCDDE